MEFFSGIIIFIAFIAGMIFFKGTIKKTAAHSENIVTTIIDESTVELTKRSMAAYQELLDEFGEDFLTPEEIYNKMQKKGKKSTRIAKK